MAFHQQFAPLFGCPEVRQGNVQYVRGLLTDAPWPVEPVIAALQQAD